MSLFVSRAQQEVGTVINGQVTINTDLVRPFADLLAPHWSCVQIPAGCHLFRSFWLGLQPSACCFAFPDHLVDRHESRAEGHVDDRGCVEYRFRRVRTLRFQFFPVPSPRGAFRCSLAFRRLPALIVRARVFDVQ